MTIQDIKDYLRIDYDDEDNVIEALILTAKQYIQEATGKEYNEEDKIFELCLKLLVVHWFENRNSITTSATEAPYSITNLLTILSYKLGDES